ncbi:DNA replication factor C protein [Naegleria gruberi]|uniref:DNA replication factor C protein n=1 Tax=Naegleria gruberi TaxID=5762 RepID=D2VB22_NAEGR|nr:DNA replication factor C protein [Naegleria gruberi]EFC46180.1 DNA replication factor C protein [Naegleria gruberi]|eukprot:XP_002678924.1 DNA replication factor C protein [Naegleria gruberi strain NEG-M]
MFASTLKLSLLLKKNKLPSSYYKNNFFNFFYSNNQQHCSFSHNINHITQHQEKACSDNDNSSPSSSSREKLRDMIQQYSHSIPDHLVRASSRMNPAATTVATEQHEINKSRKLSIDLPMDPKKPYGDNIQMKEIKLRKQKTTLELHFTINNPQSLVVTSLLAEFLRVESPSAEVQGEGGQKRLVFGKRGIKISNIEMVGTNRLDYEEKDQKHCGGNSLAEQELKRLKFHSPPSHTLSVYGSSIIVDDEDSSDMKSETFKGIYYDDLPPTDKDFIACIGSKDGDMCYLTFMEEDNEIKPLDNVSSKLNIGRSFLKTPFNDLLEDVKRIRYETEIKKKARENLKSKEQVSSKHDNDGDVEIVDTKPKKFELLVDKYSPKSYLDLLTDDFQKKQTIGPEHKILLIAGPPGIGKTTLAHIAAKQAGYEPIEVNASDDRSKEKLIPEIQKVTQMQTVFGSKKPKLLILDEIDGVHNSENKSVVSEILKIAYPKVSKETKKEKPESSKSKKNKSGVKVEKNKKKKDPGLLRPIICICNDHYSPGLKELRQRSKLLVFRRDDVRTDNTQRIVDRLSMILKREHLLSSVSRHDLTLFVKDSDNDIRSCLNTIQFMSFDKSKSITEMMSITKDVKKDIFDAMNIIFKTKKADSTLITKYQHNILSLYNNLLGELDKMDSLMNGCFENYPTFSTGSSMKDISNVLEWVEWSDMLDVTSNRHQERSLQVYRVATLTKIFKDCKKSGFDISSDFIQYPKQQGDFKRSLTHKENIFKTLHSNCFTPNTYDSEDYSTCPTAMSVKDLATDVSPFIYQILSNKHFANLNSGSALSSLAHSGMKGLRQLFRNDMERFAFERILDICISYGINVKQTYVNETHENMIDPPLDEVSVYPSNQKQEKTSQKTIPQPPNSSTPNQENNPVVISESFKKIISSALHFEKLERKFKKKNEQTNEEMLEKIKSSPMASPKNVSAQVAIEQKNRRRSQLKSIHTMYLEFHDGMTNSIRRPAKTSEFL